MDKKIHSVVMLTLLSLVMLTFAFNIQSVKAEPKTWYVNDDGGADFTKIQDAINAASSGDTIYVRNGTYYEHVIVDKNDLAIIGEENTETIIDGSKTGFLVKIRADNVSLSGFTIRYGEIGISVGNWAMNIKVSDNIVKNNTHSGIYVIQSEGVTISGNNVTSNGKITILGPTSYIVGGMGVAIDHSSDITVEGNNVEKNYLEAIWSKESGIVSIERNIIANNVAPPPASGASAIVITYSNGPHVVKENIVSGSRWTGVSVSRSDDSCLIYHNNFIENGRNAFSYLANSTWDDGYPSGGNYWSDYEGRDIYSGPYQNETGSDEIGDTPYVIDDYNQDNYPLMEPWTPTPPIPTTIDELKTEIEKLGSEGEMDNKGIVKSLIAKLDTPQKLIDKGKIEEAISILEEDFIPQVQNLSGIHITPEAAELLIKSAEYIISNL